MLKMSVSYLLVPKKLTPAITLRVPVPSPKPPAKAVQPPQTSVTPQPQNNGAPELVSSRGRKRKQTVPPPTVPAKVARVSTPGTTPKATSKKQQLAEKKTIAVRKNNSPTKNPLRIIIRPANL